MKKLLFKNFTSNKIYFGETYIKHEENIVPHIHNFYEIFFVLNGEIDYLFDGKYSKLEKGSIQFIMPLNSHAYYRKNKTINPSRLINIAFHPSLLNSNIKYLIECSCDDNHNFLKPLQYENSLFNLLVKKAFDIQHSNSNTKKTILLYSILFDYFIEYINMQKHVHNDAPFWLKNAVKEMKKEKNFKQGLKTFISLTNRSQEYLSRLLKKYYNVTPANYINQLRLEYIADKLIKTDEQIISIVFDSGFNNISYFETLFKKKYNVTPSKYRQLNNNLF